MFSRQIVKSVCQDVTIQYNSILYCALLFLLPGPMWASDAGFGEVYRLDSLTDGQICLLTDFDNDGIADLIYSIENSPHNDVMLLKGNAAGGFDSLYKLHPPYTKYSSRRVVKSIHVGDYNGDGINELLITARCDGVGVSSYFIFMFHLHEGVYVCYFPYEIGRDGVESVMVADFNGDGADDIFFTEEKNDDDNNGCDRGHQTFIIPGAFNRNQLGERICVETGGVSYGTYNVQVGDYNGDGLVDFSISPLHPYSSARVNFNRGDFSFEMGPAVEAGGLQHISTSFSSDRSINEVAYTNGHSGGIFYNFAGSVYVVVDEVDSVPLISEASCLAVADMDGDGDQDLVTGGRRGNFFIENLGKMKFKKPVEVFQDYNNPIKITSFLGVDQYVGIRTDSSFSILRNQIQYNRVLIDVFANVDQSCEKAPASFTVQNRIARIDPGGSFITNGKNAHFSCYLRDGRYTVTYLEDQVWASNCGPENRIFDVVEGVVSSEDVKFALTPKILVSDLCVSLASGRARAGRMMEYILEFSNCGTTHYSGRIGLDFDGRLVFVDANVRPQFVNETSLFWLVENVPPGEHQRLIVSFSIPRGIANGDVLCAKLQAEPKRQDLLLRDNQDELCTEVTSGYDPNDIQVWPRGEGEQGEIASDVKTLSYMIRFQNTGNDTTFNVVVRDTLPAELDVRRIRFGASSHEYSVDLLNNHILEFTFADIMLPDSSEDLLGSQGFLKYRIDLVEGLEAGTQWRNRAGIYFDFNEVVLTNYAVTTIAEEATSVDFSWDQQPLSLKPNPANEILNISDLGAGVKSVSILDIHGREVVRIETEGQTSIGLDCSGLAAGTYFVRTLGSSLLRSGRFVVAR